LGFLPPTLALDPDSVPVDEDEEAFNSLWSRCRTAVEWKYHITKVVLVMFNGRVTVIVKVVMVTLTGTVQ